MLVLSDLREVILGLPGVSAAIGTNPRSGDKCCRPQRLYEHDSRPAIVLALVKPNPVNDLAGCQRTYNALVRIVCLADDQQVTADHLASRLAQQLDTWSGATLNGEIESITLDDGPTDFLPWDDGSDCGDHVAELWVYVFYKENAIV